MDDRPNLPVTSDADYHAMIDSIADHAIVLLDANGYIRNWNVGAHQLHGYEPGEAIGHHYSMVYPRELLEQNQPDNDLQRARETGHFADEGWRARKDGSRFWGCVTITALHDVDGELRGYTTIARDLTEYRLQEKELRYSEERFRLLVEGVKDYAIFMLDPGGHIISWNEGARLNKGYEAHEIIGKHFSIFYPEEVAASGWPEVELKKAMSDGRYEEEGWRVRKDGSRFWANVVITALHDEVGRHRGFAKVTRDLTEKRRAQALEDEGRRLTAFIAMLAHELRNPLAPIANAVALLGFDDSLSTTAQQARAIIARQQQQLTRLVDDLLDISRITAGKIHIDDKPVRIDDVIDEAVETIEPMLREKQHVITKTIAEGDYWVSGDRARLLQIVSNLLHNAAKFTPAGGELGVSVRRDGDSIVIAVKDNGPGIAPERLPHLFHRFTQREEDLSRTHGGLGLGLSLVYQLTVLHRGSVSAFSTGEAGAGSEFVVRLPAIVAPEQNAAAPGVDRAVLVVDDNRDSADTLALLLVSMGYRAVTAYSGRQAIDMVKAIGPQAVLLDIGLPDLDGIEVARVLNNSVDRVPPLIAVTGYGMDQDRERSFKAGFYAHLTKPVDPGRLGAVLKLILD